MLLLPRTVAPRRLMMMSLVMTMAGPGWQWGQWSLWQLICNGALHDTSMTVWHSHHNHCIFAAVHPLQTAVICNLHVMLQWKCARFYSGKKLFQFICEKLQQVFHWLPSHNLWWILWQEEAPRCYDIAGMRSCQGPIAGDPTSTGMRSGTKTVISSSSIKPLRMQSGCSFIF